MSELDGALEHVDDGRRAFIKKAVIGTAFAVPVVSSFTMSGVQAVYAQTAATSSKVSAGNVSASTSSTTTTTIANQNTTVPTTTTTTTANQNQPGPVPPVPLAP